MRKILAGILILLFAASESRGAWLFDGVDDYVTVADNAALSIPAGDWTVGGWVKLTSNTTSTNQIILEWGNAPTFSQDITLEITNNAGTTDEITGYYDDGTSGNVSITSTSSPFTSNTNWTHVLFINSGTSFNVYINGASVASTTSSRGGIDVTPALRLGVSGSTDRFLNGSLAEWAKWDRALSADEIAGLAKGFSSNCYPGFKWLVPMVRNYQELKENLTVTNTGSTVSDHPRIFYCGG